MRTLKKKSQKNMVNGRILPDDVVFEILERLPVKSLLRLWSVSKRWCETIKSHMFIKNHLVRWRGGPSLLLFWDYRSAVLSVSDPESPKLDKVCPNLSAKFLMDNGSRAHFFNRVLGPCNGLVCIVSKECIALCNPALREFKELPVCPFVCPYDFGYFHNVLARGFGNTCSNDFKVVFIFAAVSQSIVTDVQLYSLSTNSWRNIDSDMNVLPSPRSIRPQLFFNGTCHWTSTDFKGGAREVILSFNLSTELFRRLEYPDCSFILDPRLIVVNECLAMVQRKSINSRRLEVWVMKDYGAKESWTKQFVLGPYPYLYPLMSWKNGEWLIAETTDNNRLVSCALHTNEIQKLPVHGKSYSLISLPNYQESLISLNEFNKFK